jgi:hypothetical protein
MKLDESASIVNIGSIAGEMGTSGMYLATKFELTMEQWKSRPWYNKESERILAPLRFLM